MTFASILAATMFGSFSGVDTDHLLDTPHLVRTSLAALTAKQFAEQAQGVVYDAESKLARITAKDFALVFEREMAAGGYQLSIECLAPNGSTDSFWVEVDGRRQVRPFTLPKDKMSAAQYGFILRESGKHRVRLVLRESPGCQVKRLSLDTTTYVPPQDPMTRERAAAHPRIFMTPQGLAALKARMQSDAGRKHYKLAGMRSYAPPPYSKKKRTCGKFKSLAAYALAQRLSPNPTRLANIIKLLEAALTYEHWGIGSMADVDLDAEYMMEGLALTYDWLYDELPADLRVRLRDNIAEHCRRIYEASLGGRTGGGHSFQQNHFWFAHLALGMGAAAIYGEVPEARTWLGWAFDRFERVFITLGDDGGFHEQPSYWDYSMPTLFMMIDLYEQCSGLRIPHGDQGLRGAAVYRLRNMYPGLQHTAALGDTKITAGRPSSAALLWLARRYRQPVDAGIVDLFPRKPSSAWTQLLWADETLEAQDPRQVVPTMQRYSDIQMAFARTSWRSDATMFAFICRPLGGEKYAALCARYGLGGTGHNHPAQNHFVLFGRGQVLAADPGYTYKKLTRNHNTVLVDGKGQYGDGEMWPHPTPGRAHLTGFTAKGDVCVVTGDAASAYPKELGLKRFERTLVMVGRDVVIVYDRLQASQPRQFSWRLHSYGGFAQTNGAWMLSIGDARMRILPLLPSGVASQALTESPVYVHPTRNLTPRQAQINLIEMTTPRTTDATFLVPLLIGDAGTDLPAAKLVSGDGYDAVAIGDTFVAFNRGHRPVEIALPSGKTMRTAASAVVCRGDDVTVHELDSQYRGNQP